MTRVPRPAKAIKRTLGVEAGSTSGACSPVQVETLVHIGATRAVASVANITGAQEGPGRICARGVAMAVVGTEAALIQVCAVGSVGSIERQVRVTVSKATGASERSRSIFAYGVCVAVVAQELRSDPCRAVGHQRALTLVGPVTCRAVGGQRRVTFVNIVTVRPVARVSALAHAQKRPLGVGAAPEGAAGAQPEQALVDVCARPAQAAPAPACVAGARERADGVGARGVHVAVVKALAALIHVPAHRRVVALVL